jgi:UDP-glucose 4-epimerase
MNKVLVTGGAGFIGSHTVDLLLNDGIEVRALDNLSSGHRTNLPNSHPLLEFVEGDITDKPTVEKAMEGVSHCLHLAAQVSVEASLQDPIHSAMQNIIGFINIHESARIEGLERLVFASSAAVYGEPSRIPLEESSEKLQLSPYGLEKQVDEEYADMYRRLYGFSSLGLRYFNVYGPRQDPRSPYAGVIALFADRISQHKDLIVYGDGKQTRDFIYVSDVARANVAALRSEANGACNIGTGNQITLLELIDILSKITGNRCATSFESARAGDIRHSLARVEKMNRELGILAEISMEQGLSRLLQE